MEFTYTHENQIGASKTENLNQEFIVSVNPIQPLLSVINKPSLGYSVTWFLLDARVYLALKILDFKGKINKLVF